MFDCIWTYSDYRGVNRIEKPNNGKSKIQGSAEVLVAKKVKNITKPTITFPWHIFCLSSQYKPSFIVQFQSYIYISPSDPKTISLGPILSYLRSFKSVFQSVCVFSLSFLWSLILTSLCTLPTQPQRSMKGLNITGLKGEKFFLLTMAGSDGRWKRRRRTRRRRRRRRKGGGYSQLQSESNGPATITSAVIMNTLFRPRPGEQASL